MLKFEWTGAQAVHVPEVDAEHQLLFELCGRLQRASTARAPLPQMRSIVQELVTQAAVHFLHEEQEMRSAGYLHFAWHRRQHRAALARITPLERRIQSSDGEAARELLEYLSGWLNDHIGIADRMLGAYLRNRQRALASR